MKKLIAALDGLQYSNSTRDYAISLAKQEATHLVGVFLDDPTYTSYKIYELVAESGVSENKLNQLDERDKIIRAASASDFEKMCQHQGIEYSIHHNRNVAILELKHETIYADLLIIDAKETLTHYPEKLPTRFIRELLADAQCPVVVVPSTYRPIEKVILLFDGEPSSVHAIKMFSYLLPRLKQLPTEVITVNPVNASLHLPDNKLMREYMKRHYPEAIYNVTKGLGQVEIVQYLDGLTENALVVLGAYRRGTVSRWFRESMADTLMKEVELPLFIAHH